MVSLSLSKRENVNLDIENGPFTVEFKANTPALTLNTASSVGSVCGKGHLNGLKQSNFLCHYYTGVFYLSD